ncbi:hypothetical protein INT45_001077 [Circinella minor]|uniref:Inositol-tetrakisphosphate 1-kinase n=1 Tax=Circinella minor TaxID=1195481 RepID=A0A8H7VN35_9FUNG|nr:hypothetical protein INT45_001077 [Circinella minor]
MTVISSTPTPIKTIGLIFNPSKIKQLRLDRAKEYARQCGLNFVFIDLERSIEEQMPFDLIVHKMSDIHGKMLNGDVNEKLKFERFLNFCTKHPHIKILDPWENVKVLLDRKSTYEMCVHASETTIVKNLFHVPKSVFLNNNQDNIKKMNISFPAICKRQKACGTGESHLMVLVPSKDYLVELQQHFELNEPVIFQEFIEHDGVLIKVYFADGQLFTFTRPSFKNKFNSIVAFNSQKMPKSFDNNKTSTLMSSVINTDISMMKNQVNHDPLQDIANHLQNQLGVTMFGFD